MRQRFEMLYISARLYRQLVYKYCEIPVDE